MKSWLSRNFVLRPVAFVKGERIGHHLSAYRKSQWLPLASVEGLQAEALKSLLNHALSQSEFHKSRISRRPSVDSNNLSEVLSELPLMSKSDLAERLALITTPYNWSAVRKTTGGSTGQAVTLIKNADALARERAATYRAYEWAGVEVGAPQARFWGVPHTRSRKLYYRIADFVSNRHRFSAFNFDEATLNSYYVGLLGFQPTYLYGYVSMLVEFAAFLRATGKRIPPSVRSAITTSEILTASTRQDLESAFGVPVFNEYGCGEVGSIAHECEAGSLHLMAENLIVEILDENGMAASTGEIVVTDLHNFATPLIRYKLGDFASIGSSLCKCGRGLRTISGVHGRAYDLIRSSDGRSYHPEAVVYVFEMIKEELGSIRQFQVEQVDAKTLLVRLVPIQNLDSTTMDRIVLLIHQHVSALFEIKFEIVEEIAREKSGKLRLVKSCFSNAPPRQMVTNLC